ncbi:NPHP4 [Mytilus edulis]|uniref:NPHP4 n=1 Tax=Mytilus edulis TaxID=6550 RepID=A0A8S3R5C4_MYTED|nr:NPHP4 [Mytilus edulis]
MAVVSAARQWKDLFEKNVHLPPAFDRVHTAHDISTPFCIGLKSIEGLSQRLDVGKQPENQIRVSLYDATYKNFLGRQWLGPLTTAQGGGENKPRLKYNQNVYFHTSINSIGVMAIVEVISITMDQNGNTKYHPCGWTIVRIFKTDEELPDSSRSSTVPVQKIQMYYGSPRALYFMEEPLEENNLLKQIPDCFLHCTIATHKAMLYAMTVMPENVIVGNNDVIPGLLDGNTPGKDRLKKAKLHRQVLCTIEALNIHLPPSVEKFEDELCALLSEDRRHRENRQTGTNVSIVERRLLIGVHNGWCYLSKPELHHLDVWSEGNKVMKPQASPSMRRSQKYMSTSVRSLNGAVSQHGQGTMLVLKNRLEISELLEDPMLSLVFTLEYVIGEPISQEERKMYSSLSRGNSRIVALRWCAWNPFLHPNQENISISLMGGAVPNPNDDLTYKLPDTKMQDADAGKHAGGSINFYWKCSMDAQSLHVPMGAPHFLQGSMPSVRSDDGSEALPSPDSGKKPPSGRVKSFAGPHSLQVPQMQMPQMQMPQTFYPQGYPQQMPQMPPMYGMAPNTYMPMMQGPAYDISHRQSQTGIESYFGPAYDISHRQVLNHIFGPAYDISHRQVLNQGPAYDISHRKVLNQGSAYDISQTAYDISHRQVLNQGPVYDISHRQVLNQGPAYDISHRQVLNQGPAYDISHRQVLNQGPAYDISYRQVLNHISGPAYDISHRQVLNQGPAYDISHRQVLNQGPAYDISHRQVLNQGPAYDISHRQPMILVTDRYWNQGPAYDISHRQVLNQGPAYDISHRQVLNQGPAYDISHRQVLNQGPAYDISHRQVLNHIFGTINTTPHPEISEQVFRPRYSYNDASSTARQVILEIKLFSVSYFVRTLVPKAQGLSRAAYARLYSAGFHPILDRNKEPPEVIDPNVPVQIDLIKEEQDTLQCNEIIFQFLAFSKYGSDIQEKNKHAGTVFFTFQFYRCPQVTTERLLLAKPQNDLSSDPLSMPFILQRLEKDGALSNGPPGLEVKYYMDPMSMKIGEVSLLLSHLYRQRLHIDVWDGDSLMRIGSASVPLMVVDLELDVVMMEYDDPNLIAGTQSQGAQPLGIQSMMKGKLHFRMANVGHYSDPKANLMVSTKSAKVISNTAGNIAYPGGSLNTNYTGITPKKKVARAHHITESNREVAALLHSHQDQVIPERDNNREETRRN